MAGGIFYHNSLDWSISKLAGCLVSFYYYCFIEIPVVNANNVDPEQMLCSVASDLGLHYLPITVLGSIDYNGLIKCQYHYITFTDCCFL